jgi:histidinol-phosphate aminotransferase
MTLLPPRPRPAVDGLPVYKPGKSAEVAMREHALDTAIKLASNENPYEPLPSVVEAVRAGAAAAMHRYPDHRATAVREALAARHGLSPEQVMVGCGSVGLLQQLLLTYADPGDEVLYGWRSFEAYPIYTETVCAESVQVRNRFEAIDLRGLIGALTQRTRIVFVTSPNNPTGTAVRGDELEALLEAVPEHTVVVLDEAYHEYVTGAHAPAALSLLQRYPNLVVLRTFSKAYGLAALRIGYLFAHPEVVSAVDRTLVPFAVNGLAQVAALASLDASAELEDRVRHTILERQRVAKTLREIGLGVPDTQANFVWLPAGSATTALTMKLESMGVVTRPFPGEGTRVTTGTRAENDRFLDALDACLEPLELAHHWLLPTGATARNTQRYLDRIDAAQDRLVEHAVRAHAGHTAPDEVSGETWEAGQVWAHLSEFGGYWLGQLERIVDAASSEPVPFGRTKADAGRVEAIERGRGVPAGEHLAAAQRGLDALRAYLPGLSAADWGRLGVHETLGRMDVPAQLERFHIGHVEEHLDQLDSLVADS